MNRDSTAGKYPAQRVLSSSEYEQGHFRPFPHHKVQRLYPSVNDLYRAYPVDTAGAQIERLPVLSNILFGSIIQTVITFVLHIFFE